MTRLALAVVLSLAAGPAGAKPPNPFQGELAPEEVRATKGEEVALVLTLRPIASFPAAQVVLRLPPGLELVKGQRRLTVKPVAEGSERVLRWRIRVRELGAQEIWVDVAAVGIAPDVAARAFRCVVNPGPPPPPPTVKRGADGTEYRVHEIPLRREPATPPPR